MFSGITGPSLATQDRYEREQRRLRIITRFQRMHTSHEYHGEAIERVIDLLWTPEAPERVQRPMPGTVSFQQGVDAMRARDERRRLIRRHMEKIADAFADQLDEEDGWR